MISFFGTNGATVFAVESIQAPNPDDIDKLCWLFGQASFLGTDNIASKFIGPRANMITPWSTNAVEICQNMSISNISRIESFRKADMGVHFDPMLQQYYEGLNQNIFTINHKAEDIKYIDDIPAYNAQEGLALNDDEVEYLQELSRKLGRKLTDSEVFGFSQVNSEHCRHKIFNGKFVINGKEMEDSLFSLIKKTSKANPNYIVSAYKDNVAFLEGPAVIQFAPAMQDRPDFYIKKSFDSVISIKAETHNFPTTVEPFNGAATGSGGEIRDRMAGGQGAIPLAGTALYITSYPRLSEKHAWEQAIEARKWLYQTPLDILIKASNGASDFGNKFGQPLINGSLLCFEHEENGEIVAFDKVIMLAGGIGYGKKEQALKKEPSTGDRIIVMGGDNYRIGMGGAAVSSADTGAYSSGIELNAVQRSNPEMQKRVSNAVRSLVESDNNPIISIHDHGAGGHLNCLSELVENSGGKINLDALPIGDPTLSAKEIIGNESQERMGMLVAPQDIEFVKSLAERERAPFYEVGEVTGDHHFSFYSEKDGKKPIDLALQDMFGNSPKTVMKDSPIIKHYANINYEPSKILEYLSAVLRTEAVACKDWLTNKVDRCVGGKVAVQQCTGELQLPLNNCGVSAIDFDGFDGIASSMGHAPAMALIDPAKASRIALTEALSNIIWAPMKHGLKSVSLSANWMWPCNNAGEDARLYSAVSALSEFAIDLGINIPTGKDSLSMKQKYPDREVLAPGTVVISAAGHCQDIRKVVEPGFKIDGGDIYYINLSTGAYVPGGSSFAQVLNVLGNDCPDTLDGKLMARVFNSFQDLIMADQISSGHDISAGGLVSCLLESCFPFNEIASEIDLEFANSEELIDILFSENNGIIFQCRENSALDRIRKTGVAVHKLGRVIQGNTMTLKHKGELLKIDIPKFRDIWYETSYLFDKHQTAGELPEVRFREYKNQPLKFKFPENFDGLRPVREEVADRPKAAILREKGSNSERELAHAMYLAGFDVKDVHMTDLISGRETLEDIQFLGAVGGFSNSDVLGSAKGWAGAFLYNEKAKTALDNFFKRDDVLSVGICNGCQLFMELNLIYPEYESRSFLDFNDSMKHESAFTSVRIPENNSVMLHSLAGTSLGVWVSHGEGKFILPETEEAYNIVARYAYSDYPSNPNGSHYNTAMMCNADGRHLVMMPHIERSLFKWNWAHYPEREDDVSPWMQAFSNAYAWCLDKSRKN